MSTAAASEASERGLAETSQPNQLSRSHGVIISTPPTMVSQLEVCTSESQVDTITLWDAAEEGDWGWTLPRHSRLLRGIFLAT